MSFEFEKRKLKEYLGEHLYSTLKYYNVIIAGGMITSLFTRSDINDVDIYFRNKKDLANFLYEEMENNWIISHTDKAFLFKFNNIKLQAIYFRFFENAVDIFQTFDFTACMGAYDFNLEDFILHEEFLKHNAQKILKFNPHTAYPIISALRVDKYKKKGYYISKAEFIKILLTVNSLNITDYKSLKEHLGGMYGENYDKIINKNESEPVDITYVIEKLSDLAIDDEYFAAFPKKDIENWEDFIYKTLGEKFRYFEYKGKNYKYTRGSLEKIFDYNKEYYLKVDVSEILKFPMIRYKYVKKLNNGKYISYYNNNYEWKIGYNYPENQNIKGVFATKASELQSCSYNNEIDRALLEVIVESPEDAMELSNILDNNCEYRRLKVTKEIPLSEVDNLVKSDRKSFYI